MSFTIAVKVSTRKTIKQFSPALEIDIGEEEIDLTYTASEVHVFADGQGSALFKVTSNGAVVNGGLTFAFGYTEGENPFTEAEEKLKAELLSDDVPETEAAE